MADSLLCVFKNYTNSKFTCILQSFFTSEETVVLSLFYPKIKLFTPVLTFFLSCYILPLGRGNNRVNIEQGNGCGRVQGQKGIVAPVIVQAHSNISTHLQTPKLRACAQGGDDKPKKRVTWHVGGTNLPRERPCIPTWTHRRTANMESGRNRC